MKKVFSSCLLLLLLSGCAIHTLTEQECQQGNWEGIGREDGEVGYSSQRFGEHVKACERFKKVPSEKLYLRGWNQGVVSYCKPANGYQAGLRGEDYEDVCPKHLEPAFLVEFNRGIGIYNIRYRYRQMVKSLKSTMSEIADNREKLAKAKTEEERVALTREINEGEEEKEDLNRKIRVYEMKHANTLAD